MLGGSLCWATVPMVRKSAAQPGHTQEPSSAPCLHVMHVSRIVPSATLSLGVFQAVALDLS